jgi:hypothetical protein
MRHRLAALLYVGTVLAVAVFTGSAFADNGNGNGASPNAPGSSGNAPGQVKQAGTPAAPAPAAPAQAQPTKPKQAEHAAKKAAAPAKHHAAPAHAAPDTSKQYGNGKSALQVAHEKAPTKSITASDLSGPGNSGLHKVTICHNGHLITVDVHALKAHSTHLDGSDVIPATSASQCTKAAAAAAAAQSATATPEVQTQQPCTATRTETVTTPGYVLHHTGSKTNPWVKLKYNAHSAHVAGKHADDVVVAPQTATRTVTVPAACESSTQASSATQSSTASETQATSAGVVSATQALTGTAAPATQAGAVLGATATLTPAKAAAKPAAKRAGGVLGATARIGSAVASKNLPFTGLPLWIFVAVAAALVGAGVLVRRASDEI